MQQVLKKRCEGDSTNMKQVLHSVASIFNVLLLSSISLKDIDLMKNAVND